MNSSLILPFVVGVVIAVFGPGANLQAAGSPAAALRVEDKASDRRVKAETAYRAGMDMVDNSVLEPAVDLFYKAISYRKEPRYYVALANVLRDLGKRELAFLEYRNAFDLMNGDDPDREGTVTMMVSLAIDLARYDEARKYLPALERYDPYLAREARNRIWMSKGRSALDQKQYARAYKCFLEAMKDTDYMAPAREGCCRALDEAAVHFEKLGRHRKALSVLLKLYRLYPDEDVAVRIQGAFIRAGRPRKFADRVRKVLKEHKPDKASEEQK